jgi:hypothetical protein
MRCTRCAGFFSRRRRTTRARAGGTFSRGGRLAVQDLEAQGRPGGRVEGPAAGEHLVQDGAQGEDIGSRVQVAAGHLLGGEIRRDGGWAA